MKDELFATLSSMKNGKYPWVDKIPCEFYKVMWNTIGDDLGPYLNMFKGVH